MKVLILLFVNATLWLLGSLAFIYLEVYNTYFILVTGEHCIKKKRLEVKKIEKIIDLF